MVRMVIPKRVPIAEQVHKRYIALDCGCTVMFRQPWPHSTEMVSCLRHGPVYVERILHPGEEVESC